MNRRRLTLLGLAAAVMISIALFVSSRREGARETPGRLLDPALAGQIQSVIGVTVRKGGSTAPLTLHKTGEQWTVQELGDYPADVSKLRKLLSALSDAKVTEEKTSDPARYAILGVEDVSQPGATGTEVTVVEPARKFAVIVGKPIGQGSFVRRSDEKQSYSVEPAISLETEPRFWMDTRLIDVPGALIQRLEIKPADGEAYVLHRVKPGDAAFVLENVPAGRQALDGQALAPQQTMLGNLKAENVAPVGDVNFSRPSRAVVTFTDGGVMTLTGVVVGDKHWLTIESSKESPLAGKARGRAFEVASYRYEAIFRPVGRLLAPRENPAAPHAAPHTPPRPRAAAPGQ